MENTVASNRVAFGATASGRTRPASQISVRPQSRVKIRSTGWPCEDVSQSTSAGL
jgi:hypothetical protein